MNKPLLLTLVVGIAVMMMFSVLPAMAMNKGELVDAMAKDANLSKADAGNALNALTGTIRAIGTDEGIKNSMLAKINYASELTDDEKFRPAINVMNTFLKQIDKLSGKTIEKSSAQKLVKQGTLVIDILEKLNREMVMPGDNITISKDETLTVGKSETLIGNITVDGGTLIINQGTIDGNIKIINGGTLLINQDRTIREGGKTIGAGQITEITQRAVVTGTIKVTDGTIDIEKSDIRRGIKADNSSLRIDTSTTGGDIEVKNSSLRIDSSTTGGDMEVKKSNIQMTDVIIVGSLEIKDSSVNIDGVTVGENDNLQIKAKKVAKFKAGKALADTVK